MAHAMSKFILGSVEAGIKRASIERHLSAETNVTLRDERLVLQASNLFITGCESIGCGVHARFLDLIPGWPRHDLRATLAGNGAVPCHPLLKRASLVATVPPFSFRTHTIGI